MRRQATGRGIQGEQGLRSFPPSLEPQPHTLGRRWTGPALKNNTFVIPSVWGWIVVCRWLRILSVWMVGNESERERAELFCIHFCTWGLTIEVWSFQLFTSYLNGSFSQCSIIFDQRKVTNESAARYNFTICLPQQHHNDEYGLQLSYTKSCHLPESSHAACIWLVNGCEWKTKKQTWELGANWVLDRGE